VPWGSPPGRLFPAGSPRRWSRWPCSWRWGRARSRSSTTAPTRRSGRSTCKAPSHPTHLGSSPLTFPTLPSPRCCSWPGWPPRCWAGWACGPPPAGAGWAAPPRAPPQPGWRRPGPGWGWPAPPGWRRTGSSFLPCTTRPPTSPPRTPQCAAMARARSACPPPSRPPLPAVTAALDPVLSQVAGLPGAPVRVSQVAITHLQQGPHNGIEISGPAIGGNPPVLSLPFYGMPLPGAGHTTTADFIGQLRGQVAPTILDTLIGGGRQDTDSQQGTKRSAAARPAVEAATQEVLAQQAIKAALAQVAGVPPDSGVPTLPPGSPGGAAAQRFA